MSKKKYTVSKDIKKQIIERVKQGEKPITEIAAEHGLSPKTIYNWLARGVTSASSLAQVAKLKRENKALLELIGEITVKLSEAEKKEDHYAK